MIKKGDKLTIPGAPEPMVASRDETYSRVWVMTEREYLLQEAGEIKRGEEEPYLVAPDHTLMRDFQHGFPD